MFKRSIKQRYVPYMNDLVEHDLKPFHDAFLRSPILSARFKTVSRTRLLMMVKQIMNLLRYCVRGGSVDYFAPIKHLHSSMNITEEEINEFFNLFIQKGNFDNELGENYWEYLKLMKQQMLNAQFGGPKSLLFFMEVRRNKILQKRFSSIPPKVINMMSKKVIGAMESPNVELEYPHLIEQHRQMNITEEELDEFTKLYFKICNSDSDPERTEHKIAKLKISFLNKV